MKVGVNSAGIVGFMLFLFGCGQLAKTSTVKQNSNSASQNQIGAMLDSFNVAAAKADYDRYFSFFTDDAIFIGTDATEHWDKQRYMLWAKPYFDKKRTWRFASIQRHIYMGKAGDIAWFDELLNTQMKICRGSGVVVRQGGIWKVQQYVLSMTVPNSQTKKVVEQKAVEEDAIIKELISR
jgi:ketosteroid isomerase-like protein